MNKARKRTADGFSLLEVLLATSILLGCAVVLFELVAIGREHIHSTEELAMAQRICETRINEILAGVEPVEPVDEEEIIDEAGWKLAVEVNAVDRHPGLAALRVRVFREVNEHHQAKWYALVRWIRDPRQAPASTSSSDSFMSSAPGLPASAGTGS